MSTVDCSKLKLNSANATKENFVTGDGSYASAMKVNPEQFTKENFGVHRPIDGFATSGNYHPYQFMTVMPGYYQGKYDLF